MRIAFGRGFDSRRLHLTLRVVLFLLTIAFPLSGQEGPVTVFEGARKTLIPVQIIEGSPYLRVADLQTIFGFTSASISANQSLSMSIGPHNVILSANRSLVSLDQKLLSLKYPIYVVQGQWYVPFDFISKVLKSTSDKRILWLENTRSLILGDILPNQVSLKYAVEADHTRLVFQSVRPIPYRITYSNNVLTVAPQSEDYVPAFQETAFEDGVLRLLKIDESRGRKIFRIEVDANYASYKSFELNEPPRLVIDFFRKAAESTPPEVPVTPPPPKDPSTLLPSVTERKNVIVIDPGHGGEETGAAGKDGTLEKDVVMGIARKLKSIIESSTGVRVILTRDGDQNITLDDRTALANNNKADLFLSIHANATIRGYGKGAETYFLSTKSTDDEARNVAAVENNAIGLNQGTTEVGDDLKLILWDMAQTEYLAESSNLAETIQQDLNEALGIANRGIKQAPFRVLMGAQMPAVLIEVGFINNPAEEKLMKDSDYQMKIARSIFRSIQRFQGGQENIQPVASKAGGNP